MPSGDDTVKDNVVPPCYVRRETIRLAGVTLGIGLGLGLLMIPSQKFIFDQVPPPLPNSTCSYYFIDPSTPTKFIFGSYSLVAIAWIHPLLYDAWPYNVRDAALGCAFGWCVLLVFHALFVSFHLFIERPPRDSERREVACQETKRWSASLPLEFITGYYVALGLFVVLLIRIHNAFRVARRRKVKGGWSSSGFGADPWEDYPKEGILV